MIVLSLPLLAISGCGGLRKEFPEERRFLLQAPRPASESNAPPITGEGALLVQPFTISSSFNTPTFVIERDGNRFHRDHVNLFFEPVENNVREQTMLWLMSAGIGDPVTGPSSVIESSWLLEGHVIRIEGDYRSQPTATLEMQFALIDRRGPEDRVALWKTYSESVPLEEKSGDELVSKWNQGLASILTQFEADVRNQVAATP